MNFIKCGSFRILVTVLIAGCCWALPMPIAIAAQTPSACPSDMVYVPGGSFTMGSDHPDFVEEKIAEDVTVSSFCIERHEVTNAQFAKFVQATGYVTVAERPLSKSSSPTYRTTSDRPALWSFSHRKKAFRK
jgi:sulfatase modifying factor 1